MSRSNEEGRRSSQRRAQRTTYTRSRRSRRQEEQTLALAPKPIRQMFFIIHVVALAVVLLIIGRLAYIQLISHSFYVEQAKDLHVTEYEIPARRGCIYDRNGNVLAKSVEAKTLTCNPQEVSDPEAAAQSLAESLGGKKSDYLDALTAQGSYALIARKIDPGQAQKVLNKKIAGIYAIDDVKRIYPNNAIASQIIGVVDEEGEGKSGLELQYNDVLKGKNGKAVVERGRGDIPAVSGLRENTPAVDGSDIVVSIDVTLQKRCEEVLAHDAAEIGVSHAMSVMMNPHTGEILAACSTPLFNVSDRSVVAPDATNLKAITRAFEPGSTMKTVTASAAIDSQSSQPDKSYYCPAYLQVGDDKVSDYYPRNDVTYTLREILMHSSNVGSVLVEREMGATTFYDYLLKFGFGTPTGVDYPGETPGILHPPSEWNDATADNMSFGQGISVNSMQITSAVATIANGGLKCRPHFLMIKAASATDRTEPEQVISADTARAVAKMMQDTVDEGGVQMARIPGYHVAAKSGTAQIANENGVGYSNKVAISIVGFAPTEDPKVVLFTIYDGAPGVYTSRTVGYSWTAMMSTALSHLEVPYQDEKDAERWSHKFEESLKRYEKEPATVGQE